MQRGGVQKRKGGCKGEGEGVKGRVQKRRVQREALLKTTWVPIDHTLTFFSIPSSKESSRLNVSKNLSSHTKRKLASM